MYFLKFVFKLANFPENESVPLITTLVYQSADYLFECQFSYWQTLRLAFELYITTCDIWLMLCNMRVVLHYAKAL